MLYVGMGMTQYVVSSLLRACEVVELDVGRFLMKKIGPRSSGETTLFIK